MCFTYPVRSPHMGQDSKACGFLRNVFWPPTSQTLYCPPIDLGFSVRSIDGQYKVPPRCRRVSSCANFVLPADRSWFFGISEYYSVTARFRTGPANHGLLGPQQDGFPLPRKIGPRKRAPQHKVEALCPHAAKHPAAVLLRITAAAARCTARKKCACCSATARALTRGHAHKHAQRGHALCRHAHKHAQRGHAKRVHAHKHAPLPIVSAHTGGGKAAF